MFWDADQPRVVGSQHPTSALEVLERFRASLRSHAFESIGPKAKGVLTISGGLATFPWDASEAPGLLKRASDGLRQAKQSGKNRILLVGTGSDRASDMLLDAERHTVNPPPAS